MRRIRLNAPGEFVDLTVPRPVPSSGQVLVRVHRVGVCGSDFHALAGRHPIYTYPRVLGHELAGEVVEVPENARGLRPGIDAPSNRISVAANAALAKWDERTAANSCGCSVYMSMEACRDFWASRLSYCTNQTCCRLINSRLSRRWELELMPLKEASCGLWSSDEKNKRATLLASILSATSD